VTTRPHPSDDIDTAEPDGRADCVVTIELDGKTVTTAHHPGTTILQAARQAGLSPPSSCEAGNCATCMGRLTEGSVDMLVNDALYDDEVAEGFILTCQSIPTSAVVGVRYGFD
jgi:ferredoxin